MERLRVFSEKIKYRYKEIDKELRLLNNKIPFTDADAKRVESLTVELEDQVKQIREKWQEINTIYCEDT